MDIRDALIFAAGQRGGKAVACTSVGEMMMEPTDDGSECLASGLIFSL